MASPLSPDEINALLAGEKTTTGGQRVNAKGAVAHARPIQIGPMRYMESDGRCASRGCSAPTRIEIEGVPRCYSHALYDLNFRMIQTHSDWEDVSDCQLICTCNAGKHSMYSCHTEGCPVFERIQAKRKEIS